MKPLLAALAILGLVLIGLWPSHAQALKVVNATILDQDGAPLVNHSILIEGTKSPAWYNPWGLFAHDKVKFLAITDQKGYIQVVDLPAGNYTFQLVWPGVEPAIKHVSLDPHYTNFTFTEKFPVKGAT